MDFLVKCKKYSLGRHYTMVKLVNSKTLSLFENYPNTELFLARIFPHSDWIRRDGVSLRIQSECGKIRTRNDSVFGHFSRSV